MGRGLSCACQQFPDRVEVSSPGGLPTGLSEAEYLAGRVSVLRNPILAEVFFRPGSSRSSGRVSCEFGSPIVTSWKRPPLK
ncbi:ATP-binding protein [Olsenella profusa]|uniref:ATP-binding protein n=1 Tax=Olsenella profusa TaxID=138595 RepID=UPI000A052B57